MSNIKQKSLPSQSEVQPIIDNFSNGNFNQAKIQAETLYLEYPNAVFLANILGICFLNLGDNANAEKHLKNAFSLSPNDFQTCSNLGLVLQKIGKFEEAIIYFKKAIKLNKDVPELFFNFALCLSALFGKQN